jgi:hypothetical protein
LRTEHISSSEHDAFDEMHWMMSVSPLRIEGEREVRARGS